MRVLVIDDEQDVELLFQQRFRKERRDGKIDFRFAFSAEAALDLLEEFDPADIALILSDINMPGMSGLELLKILRPRFPNLKIYMITAYGDDTSKDRAYAYGATDYLTKPLNFDELKDRIFDQSAT